MSSHHFVREDQEPALLIAGRISYEGVADLLEWAPFIMVDEPVLEEVLSWGIKIDAVLEYTGQLVAGQFPFPVQLVHYEGGRSGLLEKALEILAQRNQKNVHIAMEEVHFLRDDWMKLAVSQAVLVTEHVRWYRVSGRFEKWVPKGASFFLQGAATALEVENLVNENAVWVAPVDGIIRISGVQPFWVGESR